MLVLSRKKNQRIMLDGGIVITVIRSQRGKVRLGIVAPKEVRILREELIDRQSSGTAQLPQPDSEPEMPQTAPHTV